MHDGEEAVDSGVGEQDFRTLRGDVGERRRVERLGSIVPPAQLVHPEIENWKPLA